MTVPWVLATIALTAAASFVAVEPALSAPKNDVAAVLRSSTAELNGLDPKRVDASCAATATVVDAFAPFEWHSCAAWFRDLRKRVMTFHEVDFQIAAGTSKPVEIEQTSAYAVVPMQITWREVDGWQWENVAATFVLHRSAARWKIASVAFATLATGSGKAPRPVP